MGHYLCYTLLYMTYVHGQSCGDWLGMWGGLNEGGEVGEKLGQYWNSINYKIFKRKNIYSQKISVVTFVPFFPVTDHMLSMLFLSQYPTFLCILIQRILGDQGKLLLAKRHYSLAGNKQTQSKREVTMKLQFY